MKNSFIFYASFDEALRELPDKSRLKMYDAIADYALRGIVCDEFKGIEKAIFSLIIHQLQLNNVRYENGCKGGRPKKPMVFENDENEKTETKPMVFENSENKKTKKKPTVKKGEDLKETISPEKERSKENIPLFQENTPLFIPPKNGEKTQDFEDEFFSLYPKYAKGREKMRGDADFKRLIDEFAKSKYLRSLYTVKQVNDLYEQILRGDFRDEEKTNPFAGLEAKAARERWYAERKAKAENKAESVLERFLQDEEFKSIHRRLKTIELDLAKAECDKTAKGRKKLDELKKDKADLKERYRNILERNGMDEEDLQPKWCCKKCQDTGFVKSGAPCDCYEVAV